MSQNRCDHGIDKGLKCIRGLPGIYMCECGTLFKVDKDDNWGAVIALGPDDLSAVVSEVIAAAVKEYKEYQPVDLRSEDFR